MRSRVWWRSVMLSEPSTAQEDWMHLVHAARHAPDHVSLSKAIVNLGNRAMREPVDHPIHQHFENVMRHHAEHNRETLHKALEHVAMGEHGVAPHNGALLAALEYTPTEHAARMIGRYMGYRHRDADFAALGWLARHPHLHEHFGKHILPHIENRLNDRHTRDVPFYRFMRDEYHDTRKAHGGG